MFELLDDVNANRKAMLRPRYGFFAGLSLLLTGVAAGILIGKRNWDVLEWLGVGLNGLVLLVVFAPLFRELYNFLRDHETS